MADALFQRPSALPDQEVTDVIGSRLCACPGGAGRPSITRERDGGARHGDLLGTGQARELLDLAAVTITGFEIHDGIGAARVAGERCLHRRGALDETTPVSAVELLEAPDGIRYRIGGAPVNATLRVPRAAVAAETQARGGHRNPQAFVAQQQGQGPELRGVEGNARAPVQHQGLEGVHVEALLRPRKGVPGDQQRSGNRGPAVSDHDRKLCHEPRGEVLAQHAQGAADYVTIVDEPVHPGLGAGRLRPQPAHTLVKAVDVVVEIAQCRPDRYKAPARARANGIEIRALGRRPRVRRFPACRHAPPLRVRLSGPTSRGRPAPPGSAEFHRA